MRETTGRGHTTGAPEDISISAELDRAGDRSLCTSRTPKQQYAQRLSDALALKFSDLLRPDFPNVLPMRLPDGTILGTESRARTGKGFKKLDVNYSTIDLGLGLGVSIKTLNFPDGASKRYTKNFTRIDNELRAEAHDYHQRQPYAVMVAVVFLPIESCDDAGKTKGAESSFAAAVRQFRFRARRRGPEDEAALFERIFIGLYRHDGEDRGVVDFFDVTSAPSQKGRPTDSVSFRTILDRIKGEFDARNEPAFTYADAGTVVVAPSASDETAPPLDDDAGDDE